MSRNLKKSNNVNTNTRRSRSLEKKKKLVTSPFSFFRDLSLRTLAVAIWDSIKQGGEYILEHFNSSF